MLGHTKTQPAGNPGPPTNVLISSKEVYSLGSNGPQYRIVGGLKEDNDSPMIIVTTKMKLDYTPIGIADGRGNPYADNDFHTLAVTTYGPSTLLASQIRGESVQPGMCLYPLADTDTFLAATSAYSISKAPDFVRDRILQAYNEAAMIEDNAERSRMVRAIYMKYLCPLMRVVRFNPGSDYAQVMLNLQM